jgi:hypothetical protein
MSRAKTALRFIGTLLLALLAVALMAALTALAVSTPAVFALAALVVLEVVRVGLAQAILLLVFTASSIFGVIEAIILGLTGDE